MLTHLKNLANPFHRTGGWALPHALLIALAVGIAYVAGVFTGGAIVYNSAYFQHRYGPTLGHQIPLPKTHRRLPRIATTAPTEAYVTPHTLPSPYDQGPLGSCAANASALALSYTYRLWPARTGWYKFSPTYLYSHYSCTYNNGQDGGSWPDGDLENVPTQGVPRYSALPEPPYDIVCAYPANITAAAAQFRLPVQVHQMGGDYLGQGQGIIDAIHAIISGSVDGQIHPALVGIYVWNDIFGVSADNPYLNAPSPGEVQQYPQGVGGHEITLIGYKPGWVEFQNSWGSQWSAKGRAWISESYLEQYGFGLEYLTLGQTTGIPRSGYPVGRVSYPPPAKAAPKTIPHPPGAALQVRGIYAHDTGQNLSGLINQYAAKYNLSPVGLAATIGTESDFITTAWHTPIPGAGYCDYSGGLMQLTICTIQGLGVGNGTLTDANIAYVRAWETNPANSIWAGSTLLNQYRAISCWDFEPLYSAYNQGPYLGCKSSLYQYPQNAIAQQAFNNFQGWWNYVEENYAYYGQPTPPPKPKPTPKPHAPFSVKAWQYWTKAHHRPSVPHRWHGHLAQVARMWWFGNHVAACGSVVRREQWNARRRVMHQRFARCSFWSWPRSKGDPVKIKRLPRKEWM